jgi:GT2 family glycosyltransferase
MKVSVIIITRNRPPMVRDCLAHLEQQTVAPDEVIVVDSSTGEDTQAVLDAYPDVVRLRIPNGRNNMPQARNLGIAHAHSEVLAFLDDDSMAQPDWLRCLLEPYTDPAVGGVGGRVIDALEQSRARPDDPRIGVLQRDGKMTTNFILDPGRPVEVDHVRGCNMSFRRVTLARIGGFDRGYIGSNTCEELDVCLRIKRAGCKLVFQPLAVVKHLAAPREGMTRGLDMIEPRPVLWDAHNRAYLLFKNFGYNYWTAKNILGGRQLLFLKLLLREPSWRRARAAVLYGVGAWWGLADSIVRRVHLIRLGG